MQHIAKVVKFYYIALKKTEMRHVKSIDTFTLKV